MDKDTLLKNFSKGDINSFEYIVDTYEKRIYGFIYHMIHDSCTAEDLTQEVFMKTYQNSYKYNCDYPIEPWLFKIAYNITISYIKKNKKKFNEVEILNSDCNTVFSQDISGNFEMRDLLLREMHRFKPDVRAIFLLKIVQDLSFEQIAIMLNSSPSAIKLKFYRNKKLIMEKLEKSLKEVSI